MHLQQVHFVQHLKNTFPNSFKDSKVLEIGSLNINGSIRVFFENCEYLGVDIGPGPGVDLVIEGQNLDSPSNTYDTVASCECFEHNPYWVTTFANMHRMARINGLVFMTCATTGRPEHGTVGNHEAASPLTIEKGWGYYKNLTEQDFREKFDIDSMFSKYEFVLNASSCDLYFWGFKK